MEWQTKQDDNLKASGNSGGGSDQSQSQAVQKTRKGGAFDCQEDAGKQAALKDGVGIVD